MFFSGSKIRVWYNSYSDSLNFRGTWMNSSLARACTLVLLFLSTWVQADCFDRAGRYYSIDPDYIRSIAYRESSFNTRAINNNKNKQGQIISTDYGVMQINSKTLQRFRRDYPQLTIERLLNEPCLNIHVGAMVLRRNFNAYGTTWLAVGMYNAGVKNKDETIAARHRYAMKIDSIYKGIKTGNIIPKVIN